MASPRTLLSFYENVGASFTVDGDDLVVRPTSLVTPGIVEHLRENKAAIMEILRERRRDEASLKQAATFGLVARWSREFGYISIHDPADGTWHDLDRKDAPEWALGECRRRRELWKAGDRRAYDLTAAQMEKLWEADHLPEPGLIVEEHPLPE